MLFSTENSGLGDSPTTHLGEGYYYRPSHPRLHISGTGTLGATITETNPSGKTVQDFLPADWYSSAVYRNILDMINTLMVIRMKLLGAAYGRFVMPYSETKSLSRWSTFGLYSGAIYWDEIARDGFGDWRIKRIDLNANKAFWGYAAKKIGDHKAWTIPSFIAMKVFMLSNSTTTNAPGYQITKIGKVVKLMDFYGYKRTNNHKGYDLTTPYHRRLLAGNGYSTTDLVSLVRSLDWEMNRVHIPLPSDLRQWTTIYNQLAFENNHISWYERIHQLKRLGAWLVIMKEKTRAAIVASNLSVKVAEESLKLENAEIVKTNAEEQARIETQRLKQIEAERIAAQQFIAAEKIRLADEAVATEKVRIAAASKAQAAAALQTAYSPDGVLITAPPIVSAPPPVVTSAPPTITQATPYATPVITRPPKPGAGIVPLLATGAAAFFLF